jgi:hypothetical protein
MLKNLGFKGSNPVRSKKFPVLQNVWLWGSGAHPASYLRVVEALYLPVPVAVHLLRLWFRIPPGAWMFVCCECCVLSGRGLCDELITRLEESYQMWFIVVCDLKTSRMRRP